MLKLRKTAVEFSVTISLHLLRSNFSMVKYSNVFPTDIFYKYKLTIFPFRMLSRFASRSARSLVAAPIQVYGVSGSYAAAAYSAAVTSGQKVFRGRLFYVLSPNSS